MEIVYNMFADSAFMSRGHDFGFGSALVSVFSLSSIASCPQRLICHVINSQWVSEIDPNETQQVFE